MPSYPLPSAGEIINFIFLFAHEAKTREEGVKERPCMVVEVNPANNRVRVTPLTTKGETYPGTLAVPHDVATVSGLGFPTAVVPGETNSFTWLGYDVRPLSSTGDIRIGRFPPGFARVVMNAVLSAKQPTHIDRDSHVIR